MYYTGVCAIIQVKMKSTTQSKVEKHRLFLGIFLPPPPKLEIKRLAREIKKLDLPLKIMPESNFHLTLKFLNYLSDREIEQILPRLNQVCRDFKPFALKFGSVIEFPSRKPVVLGVDLQNSAELALLVQCLEDSLSDLTFVEKELRVFNPHLTVARIKKTIPNLSLKISRLKIRPLSWQVRGVSLIESFLNRRGAEYKIIHEFLFRQ